MRVLHIAEAIRGGVGTILNDHLEIASTSVNINEIQFIVPNEHLNSFSGRDGCLPKVKIKGFGGKGRFRRCLSLLKTLVCATDIARFDVIHLHSTFAGALGRIVLWRYRKRIIYQPHGVAFDPNRVTTGAKRAVFVVAEKLLSNLSAVIFSISDYEHQLLVQAGMKCRVVTILNGVDTRISAKRKVCREPNRFVFVGRLDRQKGLDILLEFWKRFGGGRELLIAGSSVVQNDEFDERSLARHNVRFVGWLNKAELDDLIASSMAVLVPSRWEGFGLVVAEAYRSGTAVIASDRGALPELVIEGKTGIIFSLENADVELLPALDSVSKFYSSDLVNLRIKLCREKYSRERMIKDSLVEYSKITGSIA